ncbi:MAG: DUF998 domain-containing protein, partial [Actinomycetota bacterium]|nr:DUF998 domain-containing protein [Actinomycetota bacterium]
MVTSRKLLAGGGVVGPLAFIAAWAVLGARAEGYSPVSDPISELAAADATSRVPMTAGLVALGSGVTSYGLALQGRRAGPAWLAAMVTGVAALGVAATPLQPNAPDRAHGAFAAAGYAALAATPLLSAGPLARRGSRGRA